jgi:hypothetical protein
LPNLTWYQRRYSLKPHSDSTWIPLIISAVMTVGGLLMFIYANRLAANARRDFYGTLRLPTNEPLWVRNAFALDAIWWRIPGAGLAFFGLITFISAVVAVVTPSKP